MAATEMEFTVRAFPLHHPMAFLVAVTAALLVWHQFGMNRELVLGSATGHVIEVHDDRTEGGNSVSSLKRDGDKATLECRIGKQYEWPYCDISIVLAKAPSGVDLTGFDSVTFHISYEGAGPRTLRFYIRNFEPAISHVGDWRTLKVNEIEFTVPESGRITIPIKLFRVASWVDGGHESAAVQHRYADRPCALCRTVHRVGCEPGLHRIELKVDSRLPRKMDQPDAPADAAGRCLADVRHLLAGRRPAAFPRAPEGKQGKAGAAAVPQSRPRHLETRELAGQARIDPLTGALNREGLRDFMMRQTQGRAPIKASMSVIFTDIDYFKQINDRHGHAGDDVLQRFAQLLQGEMRAADRLVRWGGEEFLIVCPHTHAGAGRGAGRRNCA